MNFFKLLPIAFFFFLPSVWALDLSDQTTVEIFNECGFSEIELDRAIEYKVKHSLRNFSSHMNQFQDQMQFWLADHCYCSIQIQAVRYPLFRAQILVTTGLATKKARN